MKLGVKQVVLGLIALTLGACSVLPEAEEIQIYHLPIGAIPETLPEEQIDTTVSVAEPRTLSSLNTSRISTFSEGQVQRYYAGARWADRAPVLVQQHLMQTLQNADLFAQVLSAESDLPADYVIHSELRAFQVETSGSAERAKVALHVTLVRRLDRQVLGSKLLTEEVALTGSAMQDTTAAIGEASDRISRDLAGWVYETLKQG